MIEPEGGGTHRDIFGDMSYELLKSINVEDMKNIYEAFKRGHPELFVEAVEDCCGMDDLESGNAPKRFGDIFYQYIVANCIDYKLKDWCLKVFGKVLFNYLYLIEEDDDLKHKIIEKGEGDYCHEDGMGVYKRTRLYEFLHDLDHGVGSDFGITEIERIVKAMLELKDAWERR